MKNYETIEDLMLQARRARSEYLYRLMKEFLADTKDFLMLYWNALWIVPALERESYKNPCRID